MILLIFANWGWKCENFKWFARFTYTIQTRSNLIKKKVLSSDAKICPLHIYVGLLCNSVALRKGYKKPGNTAKRLLFVYQQAYCLEFVRYNRRCKRLSFLHPYRCSNASWIANKHPLPETKKKTQEMNSETSEVDEQTVNGDFHRYQVLHTNAIQPPSPYSLQKSRDNSTIRFNLAHLSIKHSCDFI